MTSPRSRYFALIPAAGTGSRMGGAQPKQYATLAGEPLIAHCLRSLLAVPAIDKIFVVLAPGDVLWSRLCAGLECERLSVLHVGGATRAMSVSNGLDAMADAVSEENWVLVHDAARACLSPAMVEHLIANVADHPVGGLLAVPLADTLKRADAAGGVAQTVDRDGLWQAQTPQMFRIGLLRRALRETLEVTDEAGAVEALGLSPLLVESDASNFKVTRPFDLQMAERVLQDRMKRT